MRTRVSSAAAVFCLLLSTSTEAQVFARGDDLRPNPPQHYGEEEPNQINASFGGTYLRGNVNHIALVGGLESKLSLAEQHQLFVEGGLNFAAFDGEAKIEKMRGSLLYAYRVLPNFNPYLQTTHAHNRFLELDYRTSQSVGICVHSFGAPIFDPLLLSVAQSLEYERFDGGETAFASRGTFRLNVGVPVHPSIRLAADAFYVPLIKDWEDYRIYAEFSANFTIIPDTLSSRVIVADEYDSRPRPGIDSNDFSLMHSLVVHLGW